MEQNPISIYSVAEVAAMLGISKPVVYKLIRSSELKSRRIGRRILITGQALQQFLEKEEISEK